MTGQQIITLAAIFVALASVGASSCKVKHAEESARIARDDAESLRVQLQDAEDENARMHEILARAYDAVNRAGEAVEEAAKGHAERLEQIDKADDDWLLCPLPNSVRAALCGAN
jgi:hypothetical protein